VQQMQKEVKAYHLVVAVAVALHIVTVMTLFLHLLVASLNLTLSSTFLDIKFSILEVEDLSSSMIIIQQAIVY
jgi:succinate-acetate transporter protein